MFYCFDIHQNALEMVQFDFPRRQQSSFCLYGRKLIIFGGFRAKRVGDLCSVQLPIDGMYWNRERHKFFSDETKRIVAFMLLLQRSKSTIISKLPKFVVLEILKSMRA